MDHAEQVVMVPAARPRMTGSRDGVRPCDPAGRRAGGQAGRRENGPTGGRERDRKGGRKRAGTRFPSRSRHRIETHTRRGEISGDSPATHSP